MSIRRLIRGYLAELMEAGEDIVRGDATEQFIADHPDEIAQRVHEMVRTAVSAEIKDLCAEHPESIGQLALFPGLPAAVAIAPGVARPLNSCTWGDLQVGRTERVENIAHAEKALLRYDEELERLGPVLADSPARTVGDARHLLSPPATPAALPGAG